MLQVHLIFLLIFRSWNTDEVLSCSLSKTLILFSISVFFPPVWMIFLLFCLLSVFPASHNIVGEISSLVFIWKCSFKCCHWINVTLLHSQSALLWYEKEVDSWVTATWIWVMHRIVLHLDCCLSIGQQGQALSWCVFLVTLFQDQEETCQPVLYEVLLPPISSLFHH